MGQQCLHNSGVLWCHEDCPSLQRSHQKFKNGPATIVNLIFCFQPPFIGKGWRRTPVEPVIVHAIQLTICHDEKVKAAPGSKANKLGIIKPADLWIYGRISPTKPIVLDPIQNPLWIEEKEFEDIPATSSHQCGRRNPVEWVMWWGRSLVELSPCYPIQNPIGVKEQELENFPSSGADNRRSIGRTLIGNGLRQSFVKLSIQDTIQGTVRVEEQMLKVVPAADPNL